MISDSSGRYLVAPFERRLWTYDARWRSSEIIDLAPDEQPVSITEGAGCFAVAVGNWQDVTVSVREVQNPLTEIATGRFVDKKWQFTGDKQAWTRVPDYVLIPGSDDHPGLLRVADDAVFDSLANLEPVHQAVDIPDSRLILLVSEGGWSVYDPFAHNSFARHDMAEKAAKPVMRFRTPDEVWINDSSTMLKLDGKRFDVIDAAGSELTIDAEDAPPNLGSFASWTFAAGNELCVVPRPALGDVLVLDTVSMLPVAQATFTTGSPVDATLVRRNVIVAVTSDGRPLRARARKVRIG